MAFIRQYMAASGDPFRFRVPRFIRPSRRLKGALKKVGKVARAGLSLVPGGGLIGAALSARDAFAADQGVAPEEAVLPPAIADACAQGDPMGFARGYGWMAGDPVKSRRKAAASGPAAKAQKKAINRATPGKRTGPMKRRPGGGSTGQTFGSKLAHALGAGAGAVGRGVTAAGPGLLSAAQHLDLGAAYAAMQGGTAASALPGMAGHFGSRRRMNPANVRALRRSIRRLDGFERLVKSVRKSARGLKDIVGQHRAPIMHAKRGR